MKTVLSPDKSQRDSNVPGSNPVKNDACDRIGNPTLSHTNFRELENQGKKGNVRGAFHFQINSDGRNI